MDPLGIFHQAVDYLLGPLSRLDRHELLICLGYDNPFASSSHPAERNAPLNIIVVLVVVEFKFHRMRTDSEYKQLARPSDFIRTDVRVRHHGYLTSCRIICPAGLLRSPPVHY